MTRPELSPAALALLGLCLIAILQTGCSEKAGGTRFANLPPETIISCSPAEESRTSYVIQAYWYGADPDGCVEGFEVAAVRDLKTAPDGHVEYDSLAWGFTTSKDSIFVLPADSCCAQEDDVWLSLSRWFLLVRAIDNEGARDPGPAGVFFEASNQIPQARITIPNPAIINFVPVGRLPSHFYLEWEGEDRDGNPGFLTYKYLTIPTDEITGGKWPPDPGTPLPWLPPLDHDSSGTDHSAPPVGWWSEWVPSDCTYVGDLDLSAYLNTEQTLLTFVTARDEGGAVLPEDLFFQNYNGYDNWLRYEVIEASHGTRLIIDGGILGMRGSYDVTGYMANIAGLFYPTEVLFTFWAREYEMFDVDVEAYRYYYDNPDHPFSMWDVWTPVDSIRKEGAVPEWSVTIPSDGMPFAPEIGRHVLVVEVRNLDEVISHCEFHVDVLEDPRGLPEKKILLVDDDHAKYLWLPWGPFDETQTELWEDILTGYNWERFYTGERRGYDDEVPVRLVGSATTVIWLADDEMVDDPVSQLLNVCTELGSYLHSYVKVGGNLIIIGRDPIRATAYWTDWRDAWPGLPHPDRRQNFTFLNFNPRYREAQDDTMYNFMWEVFGIEQMKVPAPEIPFNTIWPCLTCGSAWDDTIPAITPVGPWNGEFETAFYITRIREATDDRFPLYVEPMYSTAYDTSGVITPTEENMIAVYVPGGDLRGHTAYIGFPAEWFDHDKMETMIRKLLDKFGE
ncbi:MAG: hypothetical protein ABIJ00_16210 [Candidatus Eisenbacteria bacterium]